MGAPFDKDWLVHLDYRVITPYRYLAHDKRILPVELAVVHWTASPGNSNGNANEPRIRRWLSGDKGGRVSSTHFCVLRDGTILQAAALSERTWHAAGSSWVPPNGGVVEGINFRSIGLDLENVGPLEKDDVGTIRDDYKGKYRGPHPFQDPHGDLFEPYPEVQLASFIGLAVRIAQACPILVSSARWVGHQQIRRGKGDPGPAFPWPRLEAALLGA